jgi:hypothetical protein
MLETLQDANHAIAEFIAVAHEPGQSRLVPAPLEALGSLYRELERAGQVIRQADSQETRPSIRRELQRYRENLQRLQVELKALDLIYAAKRIELWQQQQHLAAAGAWANASREQWRATRPHR